MRAESLKHRLNRAGSALVVATVLLLASGPSSAQPRAETLATCAACHGPGGNATDPKLPSIAGQPKIFIENQLVLIREGLRDIPEMKGVMAGIDDKEIVALAEHFAAQPPKLPGGAPNSENYKLGSEVAGRALCGTCHLPDYRGQQQVPRLAGQNEAYLLAAMQQFRDNPGPGRDTIMAAALYGLKDAELAQLAHFLSYFKTK